MEDIKISTIKLFVVKLSTIDLIFIKKLIILQTTIAINRG